MVDAGRLAELFKEACSLTGSEQEEFVRKVREEDPDLGASLGELLWYWAKTILTRSFR